MSKDYLKELSEAWTTICHYNDEIIHDMGSEYVENPLKEEIDIVNNALLELKMIKEAKPSEALKCLDKMANQVFQVDDEFELYYDKVKQYILKAQEQEKVLEIIMEKGVDIATFNDYQTVIEYNWSIRFERYKRKELTQQEFELLKRWLG